MCIYIYIYLFIYLFIHIVLYVSGFFVSEISDVPGPYFLDHCDLIDIRIRKLSGKKDRLVLEKNEVVAGCLVGSPGWGKGWGIL
jgi:hypothetical protein